MVKYEDVVAENRKAHEANNTLKKQLETQQQHCSQLDEQIKAFQQSEKDLRARSSQLERELNDLKDVSQDPETEPSELERGMIDLRQQLRKAEDDLQAVNIRIEKAEQVRQELEQDGAKYKVCSSSPWVTRLLTPHRNGGKPSQRGSRRKRRRNRRYEVRWAIIIHTDRHCRSRTVTPYVRRSQRTMRASSVRRKVTSRARFVTSPSNARRRSMRARNYALNWMPQMTS
jgi:seryl-tRNA synthetase